MALEAQLHALQISASDGAGWQLQAPGALTHYFSITGWVGSCGFVDVV
jgi:hypothetical protein